MSRPEWVPLDELTIVREDGFSKLYDLDGFQFGTMPHDMTDTMIRAAVSLANTAFGRGFECGKSDKAYEIRRALEVK